MFAPRTTDKALAPTAKVVAEMESMGLPSDYLILSKPAKREARLKSLRSWFDPDPSRANVLVNDVDKFVKAQRLWVEFYMKPDVHNAGVYHFKDPTHKYEMVRIAMSDAKVAKQPSKAGMVAPRGSTKTITLIQELVSMIAVVKTVPVQILMSQINFDRTNEEMRKLRMQFERNETIHRDFGGPGVLFPKSRIGGERWNDKSMGFAHNRSTVMGYSIDSAQRGRHPTLGIIDDPEDEDNSRLQEWRRRYFRWLFSTYLPMFGPGGKIFWIGTLIHEFSCLHMAMRGVFDKSGDVDDDISERDERFDSWNRRVFQLIEGYGTEDEYSIFPDKHSVEDFRAFVTTHGLSAAMAEFQGMPIAAGQFVFKRDAYRHSYMRCTGEDGDYMLDVKLGTILPWEKFLESLYIVAAVDPSDSIQASADPGAIGFIGIAEDGTVYVLDMWIRRSHAEDLIEQAYDMCRANRAHKMGIEREAMASFVLRYAKRFEDKLRKDGFTPPFARGLQCQRTSKVRRIIAAIRPLIGDHEIRFKRFEQVVTSDGTVHVAAPDAHQRFHRILGDQVDGYTDEGGTGHDDGVDVLHMAIRLLGQTRGAGVQDENPDEYKQEWDEWAEAGIDWGRKRIPHKWWSEEMWKEANSLEPPSEIFAGDMDPYE